MITVWPYGIDIIDWADNLIIDYPKENLPILRDPEEWEEWGTIVAGTGEFANRGIPAPKKITESGEEEPFKDKWEDWARSVYAIMIVYNKN